jgi:hypothetical protein
MSIERRVEVCHDFWSRREGMRGAGAGLARYEPGVHEDQEGLEHPQPGGWGQLGFFKLQRGVDALRLEEGDCW